MFNEVQKDIPADVVGNDDGGKEPILEWTWNEKVKKTKKPKTLQYQETGTLGMLLGLLVL